jgi:hypothetical protein
VVVTVALVAAIGYIAWSKSTAAAAAAAQAKSQAPWGTFGGAAGVGGGYMAGQPANIQPANVQPGTFQPVGANAKLAQGSAVYYAAGGGQPRRCIGAL